MFLFVFNHGQLHYLDMLQIAVSGPGTHLGLSQQQSQEEQPRRSDILESVTHNLRLEKSNILMLGPTGSGMRLTFI